MKKKLHSFARKFRSLVGKGKHFLILSHVRPDGDAYGCMLAVAHSLKKMGKKVSLWNPDGVVERYAFLPGADWIQSRWPGKNFFDAWIALDTASRERLGKEASKKKVVCPVVNIDHHRSNPGYGDLAYIDPHRSSCGELIFDLIKAVKMPLTPAVAECLFVAISTDTGSFQYPGITPHTFRVAADLIEAGADPGLLSEHAYGRSPLRKLFLLREVLASLKFEAQGQIGYFWITPRHYKRSGARPEDSEGLIDHLRDIRSVKVAVLFEELPREKVVRVSLRSKKATVDVNRVAIQFGGGGHVAAAGARIPGKKAEVEKKVVAAIRRQMNHA